MRFVGTLSDPIGGNFVIPQTVGRQPMATVASLVATLMLAASMRGAIADERLMTMTVELDGRVIWEEEFGKKPVKRITYRPEDIED